MARWTSAHFRGAGRGLEPRGPGQSAESRGRTHRALREAAQGLARGEPESSGLPELPELLPAQLLAVTRDSSTKVSKGFVETSCAERRSCRAGEPEPSPT